MSLIEVIVEFGFVLLKVMLLRAKKDMGESISEIGDAQILGCDDFALARCGKRPRKSDKSSVIELQDLIKQRSDVRLITPFDQSNHILFSNKA